MMSLGNFIRLLLGIHSVAALRPVRSGSIKCLAASDGSKSPLERLASTDASVAKTPAFLSHAGWPRLQAELDQLPCFTCVNAEGAPLGYERDGNPLAIFFADVGRAQQ